MSPKKTGGRESGLMILENQRMRVIFFVLTIIAVTVISYFPSVHNGFTNWDDPGYVVENYAIRDLSSAGMQKLFTTYVEGNYHPLTMLSLALEFHYFGLNPTAYHIDNLILHVVNSMLVFWFVVALTGSAPLALFVGILFGINPLHVESVAWISERKDLLYSFFFLSSMISYVLSVKHPDRRTRYLVFAFVSGAFSLLSKGMAVTLPLILLCIDYQMGRGWTRKTIVEKIPFFLLSLLFGIIAVFAQQAKGAVQDISIFPFYQRILFASAAFLTYLFKMFIPYQLSAFYPYPIPVSGSLPPLYYAAPVMVAILGWVIFRHPREKRGAIFGALFFLVNMLLILQLYPVGSAIMADRYVYLSSIGVFFLLGSILMSQPVRGRYAGQKLTIPAAGVLVVAVFWWGSITWNRCQIWKDNLTLWTDVISKYQTVRVAYNNRALTYSDAGNYDMAMKDLDRALELKPDDFEALTNRGNVYFRTGKYRQALDDFMSALRANPVFPNAWNGKGAAYFSLGQFDSALAAFEGALAEKPDYVEVYLNRANVLSVQKRFEEAVKSYDVYLGYNPSDGKALYWRGLARSKLGNVDGAIDDFTDAIRSLPDFADAYYNRSKAYFSRNDIPAAREDAIRAKSLGYKLDDAYAKTLGGI